MTKIRNQAIRNSMRVNRHLARLLGKEDKSDWDDRRILVVCLHKSGTHLIENILSHAGLESRTAGRDYSASDFVRLKPNQYLRSHFALSNVSVYDLIERRKIRAVLHYRDPRDVCV